MSVPLNIPFNGEEEEVTDEDPNKWSPNNQRAREAILAKAKELGLTYGQALEDLLNE